jgi:hypothetical protein
MNFENDEKSKLNKEILEKKNEIENYIKKVEKHIFDFETKYLEATQSSGNIIRGWDQLFTAKSKLSQGTLNNPKRLKFTNNERIFSQSSYNNQYLREELTNLQNSSIRSSLSNISFSSRNPNLTHRHKKKMVSSLSLKKKKLSGNKSMSTKNVENENEY